MLALLVTAALTIAVLVAGLVLAVVHAVIPSRDGDGREDQEVRD